MSHKSDNSSLSQPLRVETEGDSVSSTNSNFGEEDKERFNGNTEDPNDLGPLPPKWEKAYTESGEVYFIDHSTGTSHWLDPRLSKFQKKSLEDCMDDELPYGWEKIIDPHYGIYFIDHVNRRTQYENPVIQAKRAAAQASASSLSRLPFTKDPVELCGQRIRTSLVKSSRGLGFTIIGGDDNVDEFLQIKSVVPKGPAWLDGKLEMGDVIVYVNDICVLGYTHNQIVRLFQSISVGSTVSIEVCRGYPLPFDPNDPNTEVVTTIAVDDNLHIVSVDKQFNNSESKFNFLDRNDNSRNETNSNQESIHDIDNILKEINKLNVGKLEVKVKIVKGNLGFGFTIADSACGQRVKKILDRHRCKNLQEGDILVEINNINVQNMSHDKVVQVLKNCPYNGEATISVQRNCCNKSANFRNKPRKSDNRGIGKERTDRSKTPTADIYCTQTREVLPARPKTPLIDTRPRHPTKSPVKEFDRTSDDVLKRDLHNTDSMKQDSAASLRLSLIDNPELDDEDLLLNSEKFSNQAVPYYTKFQDPQYFDNYNYYKNMENGSIYDLNHMKQTVSPQDWWILPQNSEYVETAVTLNRHDTGFGFRIIGGIEDRSQVAVGHIVPGGAADLDGRIKSGDEIISVDGYLVLQASHSCVVQLMNAAAARGQVHLVLRRRISPPFNGTLSVMANYPVQDFSQDVVCPTTSSTLPPNTYDVTVTRHENEGFGFVIISSVNKIGSTIGRLIEDSPAERCGQLRVGDYIVAVNHIDIMNLNHGDIVTLIKESGLSVTLTIAPKPDL